MPLTRVVYLGLVNWIITLILTRSSLFAPWRAAMASAHPKLGELVSCSLCAGTWVGFYQGFVFGGPFRTFLFDGLLYKAMGDLCAGWVVLVGSLQAIVALAGQAQHAHRPGAVNGFASATNELQGQEATTPASLPRDAGS